MTFKPVENPVFTHTLEEPIQCFGDTITELAVRKPTAGDIFRAGNPVKYDLRFDPPSIEFDDAKAFAMLNRLTGIPIEGSLERMSSNDAITCFWGIARFFIPGLSTKLPEQPAS